MDIDRSCFLLLTASLAALACEQRAPATPPELGTHDANDAAAGVFIEAEPGSLDDPSAVRDCDNARGEVASCQLEAPSGHCESFYATESMCRDLPRVLQPRAAEAAVDCMLAASGTQEICGWTIWQQCMRAGMQASCIEPKTRQTCQSLSSNCGGSFDVFACQQAMSAAKPAFDNALVSCIQEFCEVPSCIADLRYY